MTEKQRKRRRIYNKRYRKKNIEKEKIKSHQYYLKNKDEIDRKNRERAKKNRKRIYEISKIWINNNRDKVCGYAKKYRLRNPEKVKILRKKNHLLHNYGLTLEKIEEIKKLQNNICPICKKDLNIGTRIAVDHCHKTGKIRAILHIKCNSFIAFSDEDISRFQNAIEYLKKHNEVIINL